MLVVLGVLLFFICNGGYTLEYSIAGKDVHRIVLDNGFVALFKQKRSVPLVHIHMYVRAGSLTEGEYMGSGLSHYFEHMLGKRTHTRGTEEFYNDVRGMGGFDANAYTSYETTGYHFSIHKEHIEKGVEALSDMIQNSVFDEEESKREIEVIHKEFNLRDDNPDTALWETFMRTAYTRHPYRHPIIGYRSLFDQLGKDEILHYYKTMYSPDNMFLVMVGDFDIEQAKGYIQKYFSDFKRKSLAPLYIPDEPKQLSPRKVVREFDIKQTKVLMGYHTVEELSSDVAALDVLAWSLGGGNASRLYRGLRDEQSLVYSVSSASYALPYSRGLFTITMELDSPNLNKAFSFIAGDIAQVQEHGISDQELKRAKRGVYMYYLKRQEILQHVSFAIGYGEFLGDAGYHEYYLQDIQKVTNADIIRVSKEYLQESSLNTVIMHPKGESVSELQHASRVEGNREWDVEKTLLSNGATLLLKQDTTIPLVYITALFRGGSTYETQETQGVFNFLTKSLLTGTQTKTKRDIDDWVAGSGASLDAWEDGGLVMINGSFAKDDLNEALDLYADILAHASFPKEELIKVKKDIFKQIETRDEHIWEASAHHLRHIRYKSHPYSFDGIGTKETIQKLNRQDLLKVYNSFLVPKNMVLSIAGDFDPKSLKEKVKVFEAMQASGAGLDTVGGKSVKEGISRVPGPPLILEKESVTYQMPDSRKQSIIKVLFDAPTLYESEQYVFHLLMHVFSGIGGRLFSDIRGQQSLAYSTGAQFYPREESGEFVFYVGTEPDKKDQALSSLFQHIQRIKEEPISDAELNIAKNSALARLISHLQSLGGMNSFFAKYERLGLGSRYAYSIIDQVKALTAQDILQGARKYLNENKCVISIVESNGSASQS